MRSAEALAGHWRRGMAVGIVALIAVAACGGSGGPPAATSAPAGGSPAAKAGKECAKPLKQVTMAIGGRPAIAEVVIPQALGYYASEACVDVHFEIIPNSVGLLAALRTGKSQYSGVHPSATLTTQSQQTEDIGVVSACAETHKATWGLGVRPDSPINSIKDLRGKKIGVANFTNSEAFGIKAALAAEGIDPEREVTLIQTTQGAAMGNALQTGQVDALASGDIEFPFMEQLGFKFKMLPEPDTWKKLSAGYGISVSRDYLSKNKDEVAGVCKGMAMAQVFAITNPEAAMKLFYKMLPETKKTDEASLRADLLNLTTRQKSWTTCGAVVRCANFQWGQQPPKGWSDYAEFLGVANKVGDVTRLFTNELLPQINSFDIDAVASFAKNYVYKD